MTAQWSNIYGTIRVDCPYVWQNLIQKRCAPPPLTELEPRRIHVAPTLTRNPRWQHPPNAIHQTLGPQRTHIVSQMCMEFVSRMNNVTREAQHWNELNMCFVSMNSNVDEKGWHCKDICVLSAMLPCRENKLRKITCMNAHTHANLLTSQRKLKHCNQSELKTKKSEIGWLITLLSFETLPSFSRNQRSFVLHLQMLDNKSNSSGIVVASRNHSCNSNDSWFLSNIGFNANKLMFESFVTTMQDQMQCNELADVVGADHSKPVIRDSPSWLTHQCVNAVTSTPGASHSHAFLWLEWKSCQKMSFRKTSKTGTLTHSAQKHHSSQCKKWSDQKSLFWPLSQNAFVFRLFWSSQKHSKSMWLLVKCTNDILKKNCLHRSKMQHNCQGHNSLWSVSDDSNGWCSSSGQTESWDICKVSTAPSCWNVVLTSKTVTVLTNNKMTGNAQSSCWRCFILQNVNSSDILVMFHILTIVTLLGTQWRTNNGKVTGCASCEQGHKVSQNEFDVTEVCQPPGLKSGTA